MPYISISLKIFLWINHPNCLFCTILHLYHPLLFPFSMLLLQSDSLVYRVQGYEALQSVHIDKTLLNMAHF